MPSRSGGRALGLCSGGGAAAAQQSLAEATPQAASRKTRDKKFAANVNRDDILGGPQALGVDLAAPIHFVLTA